MQDSLAEHDDLDLISKDGSKTVHLGNSDSEFTLVVGDKSKLSSEFGLHCISTIDELNERIANLSNSLGGPSIFDKDLFDEDSDGEKKQTEKDVEEESKVELSLPKRAPIQSNVKKPLLVELHTFPGFYEEELTPLPSNLESIFILRVVTNAKLDLQNKPTFKKIFVEFFHSINSQAILQDAFWWYFCHKYQSSCDPQEKLFDRIAKNYTNLLVSWTASKYQDKLFRDYADLMSQAVYSTFCHAFPTSYRQFNAEFRDDVLALINLWMMGTKPAPRTWKKWNFEGIEPHGLRKALIIQEDAEKSDTLEFDLEKIEKQPASESSEILDGQPDSGSPLNTRRRTSLKRISQGNPGKKKKKEDSVANMMHQISSVLGLVEKEEKKNSCAAEGGPTFQRVVFNLHGRSPLVEHFLTSHSLLKDAGTSVLVQRTEIASLPPLCAETYQDLIDNVKRNSKKSLKKYQQMSTSKQKEYQDLLHKHKVENYNFTRCSERLLSNPQEVRKLSELLRTSDGKEEQEDAENRSSKLRSLVMQALEEGTHAL